MKSSRKSVVYLVLIGLVLLVTAGLILWHQGHRPDSARPMVSARPADDVVVRKEVEKIVTVEKEITADVIQDGLNDVGVLVTEEYYFTEVVGFSSIKKLFKKLELGITESSYLASYDGVVTAGIDFTKITVSKDSELHTVEVRLPKAEILNVDIDPESFELYSEKTGLGNPISAEDFLTVPSWSWKTRLLRRRLNGAFWTARIRTPKPSSGTLSPGSSTRRNTRSVSLRHKGGF